MMCVGNIICGYVFWLLRVSLYLIFQIKSSDSSSFVRRSPFVNKNVATEPLHGRLLSWSMYVLMAQWFELWKSTRLCRLIKSSIHDILKFFGVVNIFVLVLPWCTGIWNFAHVGLKGRRISGDLIQNPDINLKLFNGLVDINTMGSFLYSLSV